MKQTLGWGLPVWFGLALGIFLALELPAHYRLTPWPTFSATIWLLIRQWHPIAWFVLVALATLAGHFTEHWSVRWLILASSAGAMASLIHYLLTRH